MKTKSYRFRKCYLLAMISLLSYTLARGQEPGSIKGTLRNSSNEEPVCYATVALVDATDSSLVKGTLTDLNGSFVLKPIHPGSYLLRVSHVTYQPKEVSLPYVDTSLYHTGIILLQEKSLEMEELIVVGKRITGKREGGHTSYLMNEEIKQSSNTGLEVLKHIPGVQIDLDRNVSMQGRNNIILEVNGKRRDMAYIGQLDPGKIDKIMINDTPGAEYPAEVNGVIRIKLKEQNRGIYGRIYAEAPTSRSEVYLLPRSHLHYGTQKMHVYASYQGDIKRFHILESQDQLFQSAGTTNQVTFTQDIRQKEWSHRFHYGLDYQPDQRNQLSLYGYYNPFSHEFDGDVHFRSKGAFIDSLNWSAQRDEHDRNHKAYYALFYKHLFEKGHQFTAEGSWYDLGGNNIIRYHTDSINRPDMDPSLNETRPDKQLMSLKMEFAVSPGENWDFKLGTHASMQRITDESLKAFQFRKQIVAGYGVAGYSSSRWSINLGLRAEQDLSQLKGTFNTQNLNLLPHVSVNHKWGNSSQFNVIYKHSLQRPNVYQLNPGVTEPNPFSLHSGNPRLKPEFHQDVSLEYSTRLGSHYISTKTFYSKTSQTISRFTRLNESNLFETQTHNLGNILHYGIQLATAWRFGPVSLNSDFRLYHWQTQPNDLARQHDLDQQTGLAFESGLSAMAAFNKGITASVQFQYNSPTTSLQKMTYSDALYFIALEKSFKSKIKVGLKSALPFNRSFTYLGTQTRGKRFQEQSTGKIQMSGFPLWLTLSYRFGSGEKTGTRHPRAESMDQRAKKGF